MKIGSLWAWIGGGIGRAAATAVVTGVFAIIFGMMPWEAAVKVAQYLPDWMMNGWFRLLLVIGGLALIAGSLRWNLWSQKQVAIDDLAEDISWAIHNLLNCNPKPANQVEIDQWSKEFTEWCDRVSSKLENRAFFTRADQLHFNRLGFVPPLHMTGNQTYDWWLGILRLKFERLRDVINWTQTRTR